MLIFLCALQFDNSSHRSLARVSSTGATKLSDYVDPSTGDRENCTDEWASAAEGTVEAQWCQPQLQAFFKTKFDPNKMTCTSASCPSGTRVESIGQ